MFSKNWKNQVLTDTFAFGSLTFYLIILARSLIGPYWDFALSLIISAIILFLFSLLIKKSEYNLARLVILSFFTILFYNEIKFTIFVAALFIFIVFSFFYLKRDNFKILAGLLLGVLATLMGYWLSPIVARFFNLGI